MTEPVPAIPDHEMLQRIGGGSYGEVWLARSATGVLRAVKILRRSAFEDERPYEREFTGLKNFEPVSRGHEGLVDVLQVGRNDAAGHFYCVMELADDAAGPTAGLGPDVPKDTLSGAGPNHASHITSGASRIAPHATVAATSTAPPSAPRTQHAPDPKSYRPLTLDALIRERGRVPVSECVRIAATLADALHYLHERGLVHRDIKPSNIIFVNGVPKLADVGLVARTDSARSFVGTEGFVPPEGPGTVQADLYSLGKCLYEMAMGKDRQAFPSPPTLLDELPDRKELLELNEVITRACEPDPKKRYQTARALLTDLQLLQKGGSVREAAARSKRHRMAVKTVWLATACMAVGALVWLAYYHYTHRVLLAEYFDGAQLDTKRWAWSCTNWGVDLTKGRREFSVSQRDGEAVLHAKTEQEDGLTTTVTGWLDLTNDLRRMAPCRVDVRLSAAACRGGLAFVITDHRHPKSDVDFTGLPLFKFDSNNVSTFGRTSVWDSAHIRLRFCPRSQAALVWPDADNKPDYEVVDLSKSPSWHLRFWCWASADGERPRAFLDARLKSLVVRRLPDNEPLVGWAIEKISGWPIPDATVSSRTGRLLAKTRRNGAFVIEKPPNDGVLVVEKPGFDALSEHVLQAGELAALVRLNLVKRTEEPGDIVATIPIPQELMARSIGFWNGRLVILCVPRGSAVASYKLHEVNTTTGRIMEASLPVTTPEVSIFSVECMADCGGRLIALSQWPGIVWDLSSDQAKEIKRLEHDDGSRLNWPCGCAFDGRWLWFTENDNPRGWFALHAFDLETRTIVRTLTSKDRQIQALAYDGQQFWISTVEGNLFVVDREKALTARTVEEARSGKELRGAWYHRLTFGDGYLWSLEFAGTRICKIKITE